MQHEIASQNTVRNSSLNAVPTLQQSFMQRYGIKRYGTKRYITKLFTITAQKQNDEKEQEGEEQSSTVSTRLCNNRDFRYKVTSRKYTNKYALTDQ